MSIKLLKRLSCGIISGVCCCLFCLLLATAANADVCFLPTGQCEAASANLSTGCSGFNLTGAKDETGWNCTQCGEKWKCEKKSCKDDYKTDVRCSGTETKVCDETRKAGDESCCKCEDSVTKCQHEGYVYKTTNTNENCTGKCPYNASYFESCECNAKYDKSSNTNACYTYNTCELGDLAGTKKYEQASDVHKCKAYIDNAEYVTDNSEQVKSGDYDCTLVCTETCDNSNRKYYQCSPKNNDCTGCDYCIAGTCKSSGENRIISDSSTYEKCADSCGGKYRCKTGYTAKYAGSNQYKCVKTSGCYYDTVAQCKTAGYTYTAEERWWVQDEYMTHECEPCDCGGTEMNKCTPIECEWAYDYDSSTDNYDVTVRWTSAYVDIFGSDTGNPHAYKALIAVKNGSSNNSRTVNEMPYMANLSFSNLGKPSNLVGDATFSMTFSSSLTSYNAALVYTIKGTTYQQNYGWVTYGEWTLNGASIEPASVGGGTYRIDIKGYECPYSMRLTFYESEFPIKHGGDTPVTCTIDPDDPDVFDPGYWQLDNISCDNGTTKATPGAVTLRYTSDAGCHTTVDVTVGKGTTMTSPSLSTASGSCSGIGCTIRHGGNSWCSQVKNTCSIFGSEFSKDSTGYYVTENGQKIYWKVDGSENYTGDCSAGGGCESQYKSQCDSWGGTLKSSTSYVNEDVCHAVFGECDNKYWYCLKPGCSDSGSVTVYYDAPTNCNAPMRLTHQSSGVTIMTAATTNNVPAGTYTISPSSGSIQSYTIRMGRGGTPSTKTGTTTYTFSAGNEYWIVPNCSSGGGCQNNSDCNGGAHTACGIRWTACMEMTSNAYSYCMGQAGQSSMMQGACSGMYAANKATCNNYKNYECMICQSGACLPDPVEPNWSSRLQHYSN